MEKASHDAPAKRVERSRLADPAAALPVARRSRSERVRNPSLVLSVLRPRSAAIALCGSLPIAAGLRPPAASAAAEGSCPSTEEMGLAPTEYPAVRRGAGQSAGLVGRPTAPAAEPRTMLRSKVRHPMARVPSQGRRFADRRSADEGRARRLFWDPRPAHNHDPGGQLLLARVVSPSRAPSVRLVANH